MAWHVMVWHGMAVSMAVSMASVYQYMHMTTVSMASVALVWPAFSRLRSARYMASLVQYIAAAIAEIVVGHFINSVFDRNG